MKIFYVIDENGQYKSEDGTTRFSRLCGEELYAYLQTPEGSKKVFNTDLDDNGDEIGIEVPESEVKEHLVEKRRKQYVQDTQKASGFIMVSINTELEGVDGESMTYADIIANDEDDDDFIKAMQKKADLQTLRYALSTLLPDEFDLIFHLYLLDTPNTESEYGERIGKTQQAVHKKKKCILKKMKSFF